LADFAIWATVCEGALGLEKVEALEVYRANCAQSRNLALEESPIYERLREVARVGFSGTSSELLSLLSKVANDATQRSRRWPNQTRSATLFTGRNLRSSGIEIYFNRADHQVTRVISVKSASLAPKRSSASSAPQRPQSSPNRTELGIAAQQNVPKMLF
jgi:hypothetical protein